MSLVKKLLVPIVFFKPLEKRFQRLYQKTVPVFVIHRVQSDEWRESILAKGVEYLLSKGFDFVQVHELVEKINSGQDFSKVIALTFDDGYRDQLETAKYLYERFGVKSSFFVIGDLAFKGELPWDEKARIIAAKIEKDFVEVSSTSGDVEISLSNNGKRTSKKIRDYLSFQNRNERISILKDLEDRFCITAEDYQVDYIVNAEELQAAEYLEILPHTMSHLVMNKETSEAIEQELVECDNKFFSDNCDGIKSFAYPLGKLKYIDFKSMVKLKELGFESCFTTEEGYVNSNNVNARKFSRNLLPRISFPDTCETFLLYSSWFGRFIEKYSGYNPSRYIKHRYGSKKSYIRHLNYEWFGRKYSKYTRKNIEFSRVSRLIFICSGNICRSPFGEMLARKEGVSSLSCGVHTNGGFPANDIAIQAAMYSDIDLTQHNSSAFDALKYNRNDLLLFFDPRHIDEIEHNECLNGAQIALIGSWCVVPKLFIPDPYMKSMQYFRNCFHDIESSIRIMLKDLVKK